MARMKWYDIAFITLLVVGGLNWGLAVFNFNLVTAMLGNFPFLVKLVYGLVGISAIGSVISLLKR